MVCLPVYGWNKRKSKYTTNCRSFCDSICGPYGITFSITFNLTELLPLSIAIGASFTVAIGNSNRDANSRSYSLSKYYPFIFSIPSSVCVSHPGN